MFRGMRKPHELKVRCYDDRMIELKEYLDSFPGVNTSVKIGET